MKRPRFVQPASDQASSAELAGRAELPGRVPHAGRYRGPGFGRHRGPRFVTGRGTGGAAAGPGGQIRRAPLPDLRLPGRPCRSWRVHLGQDGRPGVKRRSRDGRNGCAQRQPGIQRGEPENGHRLHRHPVRAHRLPTGTAGARRRHRQHREVQREGSFRLPGHRHDPRRHRPARRGRGSADGHHLRDQRQRQHGVGHQRRPVQRRRSQRLRHGGRGHGQGGHLPGRGCVQPGHPDGLRREPDREHLGHQRRHLQRHDNQRLRPPGQVDTGQARPGLDRHRPGNGHGVCGRRRNLKPGRHGVGDQRADLQRAHRAWLPGPGNRHGGREPLLGGG